MSKRYTIKSEHESDENLSRDCFHTDLILEAAAQVEARREDDDGSYRFWIVDNRTGRKVTRGDVRRARARREANLATAQLLRDYSGSVLGGF